MSNSISAIAENAFTGCESLIEIQNIEALAKVNKKSIAKLSAFSDSKVLTIDISSYNLDVNNFQTITNSDELKEQMDKEIAKYNSPSNIHILYDFLIKGDTQEAIAKKYTIPVACVDIYLREFALKLHIDYLDNKLVPLNFRYLSELSKLNEIYNPTKIDFNYICLKVRYLKDEEISQLSDELKSKVEELIKEFTRKVLEAEEEKRKAELEIIKREYECYPMKFMEELCILLHSRWNKQLVIDGVNYEYSITLYSEHIVELKKKNIDSHYELQYDVLKKEIIGFDFKDKENLHKKEEYEGGLCFINEFYNLFIHIEASKMLSKTYHFNSDYKTCYIEYPSHDNLIHYEVQTTEDKVIVILKKLHDGTILERIGAKQIEGTDCWFTISKSEKYTCIKNVRKFFTFGILNEDCTDKRTEGSHYVVNSIMKNNPVLYDSYKENTKKTKVEKFIWEFEEDQLGKPYIVEEKINCPKCGRPMVLKNGRYGQFYGCSGYPECKTTLSLKKVKEL